MRRKFISLVLIVSILLFGTACLKKTSKADIDQGLKAAMSRSLNSDKNIDTNKVKFTVLEVTYFEEKDTYACEFKVNMKTHDLDTTGIMSANITKDYTRIFRKN